MDQKSRTDLHVPEPPLDMARMMAFQMRLSGSFCGAMIAFAGYLGDRLGLFRHLATQGPSDADDLARDLTLDPALVQEWLKLMTAAGFLTYSEEIAAYRLPPEHAAVIGRDTGAMCFAGGLQQIAAFGQQMPALAEAFRQGGGLDQASYSDDLWEGMDRLSAMWFDHELVGDWMQAVPGLRAKLEAGASVADLGCGGGRALIRLAEAFPKARLTGYDQFSGSVERAGRNAAKAGVSDRVAFKTRDIEAGVDETFDVVTAFDSLHDMRSPQKAVAAMAGALKDDGIGLIYELAGEADRDDDDAAAGAMSVMLHGVTLFYNLPVALAQAPDRRNSTVLGQSEIRRMCRAAGLTVAQTLHTRNPLHILTVVHKQPGM